MTITKQINASKYFIVFFYCSLKLLELADSIQVIVVKHNGYVDICLTRNSVIIVMSDRIQFHADAFALHYFPSLKC